VEPTITREAELPSEWVLNAINGICKNGVVKMYYAYNNQWYRKISQKLNDRNQIEAEIPF
jgi:hypothetical protein